MLAISVCAEAAVIYDVFGERQRLGLCRQRNSASDSTELTNYARPLAGPGSYTGPYSYASASDARMLARVSLL